MKYVVLLLALCISSSTLADPIDEEEARFGFISNDNGSVSYTLNNTSVQYIVFTTVLVLIIVAIGLPLTGLLTTGFAEPDFAYAGTDNNGYLIKHYQSPDQSIYQGFGRWAFFF